MKVANDFRERVSHKNPISRSEHSFLELSLPNFPLNVYGYFQSCPKLSLAPNNRSLGGGTKEVKGVVQITLFIPKYEVPVICH